MGDGVGAGRVRVVLAGETAGEALLATELPGFFAASCEAVLPGFLPMIAATSSERG